MLTRAIDRRDAEEIVLLRTGKLLDADLLAAMLEDGGIPYYRRQELISGIEYAMPAAPFGGPGIWYTIRVPRSAESGAREILAGLPIEADDAPGPWDFAGEGRRHRIFYLYAWAMIGFVVLSLLGQLIGWIVSHVL